MSTVIEATRDNFNDLVQDDGWVLVDVWGPQCAPCMALMPAVASLAERRPDLKVVKLEAPKARRVCIDLRVVGMPTFLLFRDGEEVARNTRNDLTAEQLEQWLDEHIQ